MRDSWIIQLALATALCFVVFSLSRKVLLPLFIPIQVSYLQHWISCCGAFHSTEMCFICHLVHCSGFYSNNSMNSIEKHFENPFSLKPYDKIEPICLHYEWMQCDGIQIRSKELKTIKRHTNWNKNTCVIE